MKTPDTHSRDVLSLLRRSDKVIYIIGIVGVIVAGLIAAFAFGWQPHPVIDRGNFVAEGLALIVEATLFAVVLGYIVPERIRLQQKIDEDEKWAPLRTMIWSDLANPVIKTLNTLDRWLVPNGETEWALNIRISPKGDLWPKLDLGPPLKILDAFSPAVTPELANLALELDKHQKAVNASYYRLSHAAYEYALLFRPLEEVVSKDGQALVVYRASSAASPKLRYVKESLATQFSEATFHIERYREWAVERFGNAMFSEDLYRPEVSNKLGKLNFKQGLVNVSVPKDMDVDTFDMFLDPAKNPYPKPG